MIANNVGHSISGAPGTNPTLPLSDVLSGFSSVFSHFGNGEEIFYTIVSGINKEVGIGVVDTSGSGSIQRSFQFEKITAGGITFSTNIGQAQDFLSVDAGASIFIANSIQALTMHYPVWKSKFGPADWSILFTGTFETIPGYAPIQYLTCDAGVATNGIQGTIHLGHDVIPNQTEARMYIHWIPETGNNNQVRWRTSIHSMSPDNLISPQYSEQIVISTVPSGGGQKIIMEEIPHNFFINGPDDVFKYQIERTGGGSYPDKAYFLGVSIKYLAHRHGTPGRNDLNNWFE
jgi:hypothetical protein